MATSDELRGLFVALRELGWHALDIRDILCAAAGFKVSRVAANSGRVKVLRPLLEACGVSVVLSDTKFVSASSCTKGVWSNRLSEISADCPRGSWHLFLATDGRMAEEARIRQKLHDHEGLGELLGIPPCCRRFYRNSIAQAAGHDLLPLVYQNSVSNRQFDFWTNYAVRYFGYCLLGFAPCSFCCDRAANIAKGVWSLLSMLSPETAEIFLSYHRRSVLYSERWGVFLLDIWGRSKDRREFRTIEMTVDSSPLVGYMKAGDNIRIDRAENVYIYRQERLLTTLNRGTCALCAFDR